MLDSDQETVLTEKEVIQHIEHMPQDEIVTNLFLRETISLGHHLRGTCVYECPDSCAQSVDVKTSNAYLKTVEVIHATFRHMKSHHNTKK